MTDDKLRLGGMALRNGLLVHGPTHWAAAVRTNAGEVKVASGRKPRLRRADPIPGVRGVVRLAEAFAVIPLVKRGLPEAKLPFQDPGVLAVAAGASAGGVLLRRQVRGAAGEVAAAAVSFLPAVFALRGGELAQYHGVEHKAIGAYEADAEDASDATKEHDRCGSHLVAPMLASNLAGTLLLRSAVEKPGPLAGERSRSPRPRSPSRSSAGASATPRRAPRGRSSARASRSSGWSARASPTSASSRSAARRWRRSCAPRRPTRARRARRRRPRTVTRSSPCRGPRRRR